MKKIIALALVLVLFGTMAACTQVSRISIDDPAKLMLEKQGGGVAVTLTDAAAVARITDVVEQIPLQAAEPSPDQWTYRIQWQDADGEKITEIIIAGSQIRWEGKSYNIGVGVDMSVLTDLLEKVPMPEK